MSFPGTVERSERLRLFCALELPGDVLDRLVQWQGEALTEGRLVSRDWYEVGRFLGPSIEDYWRRHPLEDVPRMWGNAGIAHVRVRKMSLGGGVVISGVRAHRRP